jgi:hypothetical protein
MPSHTNCRSFSSRTIGSWPRSSSIFWRLDGVPTRWTCSLQAKLLLHILVPCRGRAGVNAFGFPSSRENCWANAPYKAIIGRVWRALREQQVVATLLVPMWESSTWGHLVVPDRPHLSEYAVDWAWLPSGDPNLFIGGQALDRTILSPNWPIMTVRVDFSQREGHSRRVLSKRDRCLQGGCNACWSNSWHRQSSATSSGWASLYVNRDDLVEVALAARLQNFAMAHVVGSNSKKYVGSWNKFVKWCGERLSERCSLPASGFTVALFLQSVADGAKTFAPVKIHSAAIAFFQKVNLFNHLPT